MSAITKPVILDETGKQDAHAVMTILRNGFFNGGNF